MCTRRITAIATVCLATSATARRLQGDQPSPGANWFLDGNCTPPESFVPIRFDSAFTVRSNLGGQGGRCVESSTECDEVYDAASTPHEILLRDVGTNNMASFWNPTGMTSAGEPIDMRLTNLSEYRGWNTALNGIKIKSGQTAFGAFGALNLLGPRLSTQSSFWNEEMTFVELQAIARAKRVPSDLLRVLVS